MCVRMTRETPVKLQGLGSQCGDDMHHGKKTILLTLRCYTLQATCWARNKFHLEFYMTKGIIFK